MTTTPDDHPTTTPPEAPVAPPPPPTKRRRKRKAAPPEANGRNIGFAKTLREIAWPAGARGPTDCRGSLSPAAARRIAALSPIALTLESRIGMKRDAAAKTKKKGLS